MHYIHEYKRKKRVCRTDASKIEQSFSLERSFGALKTESELNPKARLNLYQYLSLTTRKYLEI